METEEGAAVVGEAVAVESTQESAIVRVSGDATRVVLLSSTGKEYPPGEVPAGAYEIRAVFEQDPPVTAARIEATAGSTLELTCDGTFGRCQ